MSYSNLIQWAAPEAIVVIAAFAVLAADLVALRGVEPRIRFVIGGMIAGLGCAASIVWMTLWAAPAGGAGALLTVDPVTQLVKTGVLALALFTILLAMDSDFTTHVGEFYALLLLAAVGMMFLVSSADLLMIFISLELTSLSLYILTAFDKHNVKSAEAALKYFLFGGMSAACTLFGMSLIYGLSGATNLREIAAALAGKGMDPLWVVAVVMIVIGFGFKVAAVPFHLWAPDAYQGAPIPSAAFIASGSKVASFFIFAQVMRTAFAGGEGSAVIGSYAAGWVPLVATVAALSMVLGNLAAIVQSDVRRLLAYSAIAHAGYMLIGVLAHNGQSLASLIYYAITYGLTTVGAFGVVSVVERAAGDEKLASFAGLSRRAPLVSFCMLVFMLSLAGIPPLAGFFGKFYVFAAAVNGGAPHLGLLWLVVLAVAMSAVSLYYYLQVLKQIYVQSPPAEGGAIRVPVISRVALVALAAAVVFFGCAPQWLVGWLDHAVKLAGL